MENGADEKHAEEEKEGPFPGGFPADHVELVEAGKTDQQHEDRAGQRPDPGDYDEKDDRNSEENNRRINKEVGDKNDDYRDDSRQAGDKLEILIIIVPLLRLSLIDTNEEADDTAEEEDYVENIIERTGDKGEMGRMCAPVFRYLEDTVEDGDDTAGTGPHEDKKGDSDGESAVDQGLAGLGTHF